MNISSDLKWNYHISEVVKKARKRLFCLSQLKRAGLGPNELVQFYRTCIRPITEYLRIIFPCFMYDEALVKASPVTFPDRRQALTGKFFKKILYNKDTKLRNLLPPQNAKHYKRHLASRLRKTANVKLKFPVYQKLVKFIWFQLTFCLLATAMEQVQKKKRYKLE